MKQIIVATDFSKCSLHALEYAINIANKIKANILLVWVDNTRSDESVYPDMAMAAERKLLKDFDEIIEKYSPHVESRRI